MAWASLAGKRGESRITALHLGNGHRQGAAFEQRQSSSAVPQLSTRILLRNRDSLRLDLPVAGSRRCTFIFS